MPTTRRRPVKRITLPRKGREGQSKAITRPKDLSHIFYVASLNLYGVRDVAILAMLFGSGLRVTECANLEVRDVVFKSGNIKQSAWMPAKYTKGSRPRRFYLPFEWQREALSRWLAYRIDKRALCSSQPNEYRGLQPRSKLFLTKGAVWSAFALNHKKYVKNGVEELTLICSSMENLVRKILTRAGFKGGSSHSGRRSLGTVMDRADFDFELIRHLLGHQENSSITERYTEPNLPRWQRGFDGWLSELAAPDFAVS